MSGWTKIPVSPLTYVTAPPIHEVLAAINERETALGQESSVLPYPRDPLNYINQIYYLEQQVIALIPWFLDASTVNDSSMSNYTEAACLQAALGREYFVSDGPYPNASYLNEMRLVLNKLLYLRAGPVENTASGPSAYSEGSDASDYDAAWDEMIAAYPIAGLGSTLAGLYVWRKKTNGAPTYAYSAWAETYEISDMVVPVGAFGGIEVLDARLRLYVSGGGTTPLGGPVDTPTVTFDVHHEADFGGAAVASMALGEEHIGTIGIDVPVTVNSTNHYSIRMNPSVPAWANYENPPGALSGGYRIAVGQNYDPTLACRMAFEYQ